MPLVFSAETQSPGDHRQAIREALITRRSLDAGMCVIALRFCAFLDCDSDMEKFAKPCPIGVSSQCQTATECTFSKWVDRAGCVRTICLNDLQFAVAQPFLFVVREG